MANDWYYAKDGQKFGPVTGKRLKELAVMGVLHRNDLIWSPGYSVWRPAKKFRGLLPKLDATTVSPAMSLFWRPVDSDGDSGNRLQSLFLEPDSPGAAVTPPLPPSLRKASGGTSSLAAGTSSSRRPASPRPSVAAALSEVARTPTVARPPVAQQPAHKSAASAVAEPPKGVWAGMSLPERIAIGGGLLVLLIIYGALLYRALA